MKIIVICGGNSSEKEISVKSGMAIFSSIKKFYESELVFLADDYKIIKDKYQDGDIIFIPEKLDYNAWERTKDYINIFYQISTTMLIIYNLFST